MQKVIMVPTFSTRILFVYNLADEALKEAEEFYTPLYPRDDIKGTLDDL